MNVPRELKYTKTHEWVRVEGDSAVVGITDFAQDQLSDVTYVELPSPGDDVSAQDEVAVVESVKAASDIYAPVSGGINEVNQALVDTPELINSDPYEGGWLYRFTPSEPSELEGLLSADEYDELLPDDED